MSDLARVLSLLLLTTLAGCASAPEAPAPVPAGLTKSGTFTIRQDEVLQAALGRQGEGTLIYQGWEYRFLFENMQLGGLGNEPVELEGTVYNMGQLEDFEGAYKITSVEIQGEAGPTGVWGKNQKGVVAYIQSKGQDLEINLQASGAVFTLK